MGADPMENRSLDQRDKEILSMVPFIIDRARIDGKVHNTPIVYEKNGKMVEEYPDGTIIVVKEA